MTTPELRAYIIQQKAQGVSVEEIKKNLVTHGGWSEQDVDQTIKEVSDRGSVPISVSVASTVVNESTAKYAGFWIRAVAIYLDGLILAIPSQLLVFILMRMMNIENGSGVAVLFSIVLSGILSILYFTLLTYTRGATFGKSLCGLTVMTDTFQKPSFGIVFLRETVGRFLSIVTLYIGYCLAGWTKKKQTLHDKVAHTVVVYKNPNQKTSIGVWIAVCIFLILPMIAAIGIFSSVILASLNTAREKSDDALIKYDVANMRISAEVYYDATGSYGQASSCAEGMFVDNQNSSFVSGDTQVPAFSQAIAKLQMQSKNVHCFATGDTYAISTLLSQDNSFCVDNTGARVEGGQAVLENGVASCRVLDQSTIDTAEMGVESN